MGVEIVSAPPPGVKTIHLSDVNLDAFRRFFEIFDLEPPTLTPPSPCKTMAAPPKGRATGCFGFSSGSSSSWLGQVRKLGFPEVPIT